MTQNTWVSYEASCSLCRSLSLDFFYCLISSQADEIDVCVAEIMHYIRCQFVDGKASKARALVVNCVVATQHRHNVSMLDKAPYCEPSIATTVDVIMQIQCTLQGTF